MNYPLALRVSDALKGGIKNKVCSYPIPLEPFIDFCPQFVTTLLRIVIVQRHFKPIQLQRMKYSGKIFINCGNTNRK